MGRPLGRARDRAWPRYLLACEHDAPIAAIASARDDEDHRPRHISGGLDGDRTPRQSQRSVTITPLSQIGPTIWRWSAPAVGPRSSRNSAQHSPCCEGNGPRFLPGTRHERGERGDDQPGHLAGR